MDTGLPSLACCLPLLAAPAPRGFHTWALLFLFLLDFRDPVPCVSGGALAAETRFPCNFLPGASVGLALLRSSRPLRLTSANAGGVIDFLLLWHYRVLNGCAG